MSEMAGMILVMATAAFGIGFLHSILAPAHWLPIILISKSRNWSLGRATIGALVASSGHVLLSVLLGAAGILLGVEFLERYEERVEQWGGIGLIAFGLIYASFSFIRHKRCVGHSHHGPEPRGARAPFLFLLSLGFSPCIAAVPVFVAASSRGLFPVALTMLGFSLGVITALAGATWIGSLGVMKLDHPVLEHYGESISGLAVAILGAVFLLLPHAH